MNVNPIEVVSPTMKRPSWNRGKVVGQKAPFKLKDIWAIRTRFGS